MINLSKRLESIADLVNDDCSIIDIGCDHGLLDIYLVNNRSNIKIIASDINKNALNNVINNIKRYNVSGIDTRLGNGLDVINKNEVDTVIISGMGTSTIIDIFNKNIDKLEGIDTLIIQSNNDLYLLRDYITNIGYYIDEEILVEDNNIIYTVIRFKKGIRKYSKKELFLGPILLKKKDELFYKLCNDNKNKLINILDKIPISNYKDRKEVEEKIKLYD